MYAHFVRGQILLPPPDRVSVMGMVHLEGVGVVEETIRIGICRRRISSSRNDDDHAEPDDEKKMIMARTLCDRR
jgi:hypothetical protein